MDQSPIALSRRGASIGSDITLSDAANNLTFNQQRYDTVAARTSDFCRRWTIVQ
jgi:hypothetical protein